MVLPVRAQFVQADPKLVVYATPLPTGQGTSVAISADGNTAVVGADADTNNDPAAFVWTRSHGLWTLFANLAGSGSAGYARQGKSVAVSADGITALVGGPADYYQSGAVWV